MKGVSHREFGDPRLFVFVRKRPTATGVRSRGPAVLPHNRYPCELG
jgi:hypothetical protein